MSETGEGLLKYKSQAGLGAPVRTKQNACGIICFFCLFYYLLILSCLWISCHLNSAEDLGFWFIFGSVITFGGGDDLFLRTINLRHGLIDQGLSIKCLFL